MYSKWADTEEAHARLRRFEILGEVRAAKAVNTTARPENIAIPGYRMAVRNTPTNIPAVNARAETPLITIWRLLEELEEELKEEPEVLAIDVNASLVLEPVYRAEPTPGAVCRCSITTLAPPTICR